MRVFTRLAIISDSLSINEISLQLDMKPDRFSRIGENRQYMVNPEKENTWVIESKADISAPLEDHMSNLISQLSDKKTILQNLSNYAMINTIFSIYSAESPPTVFDKEFIKFLGDINSSLDIDLYYFD